MLYSEVKQIEAALSRHPKQRRRIIVTGSSLISLAVKGLDHEAFGRISVDIATSLEDALALARQ